MIIIVVIKTKMLGFGIFSSLSTMFRSVLPPKVKNIVVHIVFKS